MEQTSLKELFQQEFSKIVAVLARRFGLKHIEIAEDIASETFLTATESWAQRGIPEKSNGVALRSREPKGAASFQAQEDL